jgi:hypothetical protein
MNSEYQSTLKSMDTEEHIDIYFYRPLGYQWARLFRWLHVTPNTVTILSIFLGVGSGFCFGSNDLAVNLLGILLLVWANTYDSCDGQLARMTNQRSALGRILDGAAGDLWFISIYACICARLTPQWGLWIWVLGAVSGLMCHTRQARLADYYRQIHLFFLKGREGSEMDDASRQVELFRQMKWSREPLQKFFQFFYKNYTLAQEKETPWFQRLKAAIRQQYPTGQLPAQLCDDFRQSSLPLMKYANFLTFNWRSITLFVSILIGMPWIYFCAEIVVFTSVYFYMHYRHEKLCQTTLCQLSQYQ